MAEKAPQVDLGQNQQRLITLLQRFERINTDLEHELKTARLACQRIQEIAATEKALADMFAGGAPASFTKPATEEMDYWLARYEEAGPAVAKMRGHVEAARNEINEIQAELLKYGVGVAISSDVQGMSGPGPDPSSRGRLS